MLTFLYVFGSAFVAAIIAVAFETISEWVFGARGRNQGQQKSKKGSRPT